MRALPKFRTLFRLVAHAMATNKCEHDFWEKQCF